MSRIYHFVYHILPSVRLESVLKGGIKQGDRSKGNQPDIIRADDLLDSICPPHLAAAGINRSANVYGYLPATVGAVDITDGLPKPLHRLDGLTGSRLLRAAIDPARCFVSDLDAFDAVKAALAGGTPDPKLRHLASTYWRKLQPLTTYDGTIRRPEVIIPYDIPATQLEPVLL